APGGRGRGLVMQAVSWWAEGDLFEGCNCDLLCPCHVSFRQKGTYDYCEPIWAAHIERGQWGELSLDNLNAVVAALAPGLTMYDGNWTAHLYLDDRSTSEQEQALIAIFSGEVGGAWARISPFFRDGKFQSVKKAPFEYHREHRLRRLSVANLISLEVEAIRGADPEAEVKLINLRNVIHGPEHTLSRSNHRIDDGALTWDNSGKNGLYSSFRWSGP
ncbi:MAG: DUF1326 domain-containing protein, partial [Dehalococcoidia bacterium]